MLTAARNSDDVPYHIPQALLEEGGLMAQFVHSNVVRLLGVVSRCNSAKLVMENCELGSLSSLLENTRPPDSRPIDSGSVIAIASDVAAGMTYLSERNFVYVFAQALKFKQFSFF